VLAPPATRQALCDRDDRSMRTEHPEDNRIVTICEPPWITKVTTGNVIGVTAEVGELVRCTKGQWMDRPPQRCPRGHWLLPGHFLVLDIPCPCGRHMTWECECGAVTYGPG
jgi:hypothetical protein